MDTLHCTILPSHSLDSAKQFVKDLQSASVETKVSQPDHAAASGSCPRLVWCVCVCALQADPSLCKKGVAGVYGTVGMVPDKSLVTDFLTQFFNEIYTT